MSRCWWILLAFLAMIAPLRAHQLAVDHVMLVDEGEGRYVLRFNVPAVQVLTLGQPILPERFRWEDTTSDDAATALSADLRFISSDGPLTAEDRIILPWQRSGVLVTARWQDGSSGRQFFLSSPDGIVIELRMLKAGSGSWVAAAGRYTVLGMEHILKGLDHLLFLCGLLLLVRGVRRLALTITAFTIAHSVTLALSVLGAITLPQPVVETIVALSIVFLAVENVYALRGETTLAQKRPWFVAFGFGLIHGLGFAGALQTLGLPPSETPLALLFFNLGVELGQLAVVVLWFTLAWAARQLALPWPPFLRSVPHYALGVIGAHWFIDRSFQLLR